LLVAACAGPTVPSTSPSATPTRTAAAPTTPTNLSADQLAALNSPTQVDHYPLYSFHLDMEL
jgi:hypothetical protein